MNVGTRELKNRLSHFLRRVREAGESIYVTDRGEVVAELRPVLRPNEKLERDTLLALAANGDISMGTGRFKDFKPIKPRRAVSISSIVVEDRR
jgi:prevent-host-death family protein